ncbi:MAG: FtsL-like putative cell division protein [Bacteroidota bacterium]
MAKKSKAPKESLSAMAAKWILSNLLFVAFLGLLVTIYIANRHYSEKNVREIQALQDDVERLRWHYLSRKSELMKMTKQSEVAEMVEKRGLSNKGKHPVKLKAEVED